MLRQHAIRQLEGAGCEHYLYPRQFQPLLSPLSHESMRYACMARRAPNPTAKCTVGWATKRFHRPFVFCDLIAGDAFLGKDAKCAATHVESPKNAQSNVAACKFILPVRR